MLRHRQKRTAEQEPISLSGAEALEPSIFSDHLFVRTMLHPETLSVLAGSGYFAWHLLPVPLGAFFKLLLSYNIAFRMTLAWFNFTPPMSGKHSINRGGCD